MRAFLLTLLFAAPALAEQVAGIDDPGSAAWGMMGGVGTSDMDARLDRAFTGTLRATWKRAPLSS